MDIAILSSSIFTGDPAMPFAQALAIKNGRIAMVGSDKAVMASLSGETEVYELPGRLITPGLTDSHAHFLSFGKGLTRVDLSGLSSWEACRGKIRKAAEGLAEGEWLVGRGWNQHQWDHPMEPTRKELDDITPNNPVMMVRTCGHNLLANSLALNIAGIDRNTKEPPGGKIDRDEATGEPLGLIREARYLIEDHIPPLGKEERRDAALAAQKAALRMGLTGVHSMEGVEEMETLHALDQENLLKMRIYHLLPVEELVAARSRGIAPSKEGERIRLGHAKLFSDGSLGAATALLHEPYNEMEDFCGIPFLEQGELEEKMALAYELGWNVAVHAIGDRAVTNTLMAIKGARKRAGRRGGGPGMDRIEHIQLHRPEDIGLFQQLGVVASVQPAFVATDYNVAESLWGRKRCRNGYSWKTLLDAGIPLQFGSDSPVEPINPMLGIQAAVTRQTPDGNPHGGWFPDQRLTLENALTGYTLQPALTSGRGEDLGSLTMGKRADITVFSKNLFEEPPSRWVDIPVEMTLVQGEILYQMGA